MWESIVNFFGQIWNFFANINWANVSDVIAVIGTALSGLLTVLCFILKLVGSAKAKKAAAKITEFGTLVDNAVAEAEKFCGFSGADKKAYAVTKIKSEVLKGKLGYTDEEIDTAIEAVISLSKAVNCKK